MIHYKQLNQHECYLIEYLLNQEKKSISIIAKILKRNKSTISREIKRNKIGEKYEANEATFHSKIINLSKYSFSTSKYKKFLNYFYEKFDAKYFGVESCVATTKKQDIVTPSIKTIYNWLNFNVLKISAKQLLRPKKYHENYLYPRNFKDLSKNGVISIAYRPNKTNRSLWNWSSYV